MSSVIAKAEARSIVGLILRAKAGTRYRVTKCESANERVRVTVKQIDRRSRWGNKLVFDGQRWFGARIMHIEPDVLERLGWELTSERVAA